ncbi:MAG: hypothetical protein M0R48_11280 [Candidatus Omnitrophica bacterium]|nr:hypothetical protein [Candidatus Omnitrophota bacterium]
MNKVISFSIHMSQLKKLKRLKKKKSKSEMFRVMLLKFSPDKALFVREKKEISQPLGVSLTDDEVKKIDAFCYNRSFAARKIIDQYEG